MIRRLFDGAFSWNLTSRHLTLEIMRMNTEHISIYFYMWPHPWPAHPISQPVSNCFNCFSWSRINEQSDRAAINGGHPAALQVWNSAWEGSAPSPYHLILCSLLLPRLGQTSKITRGILKKTKKNQLQIIKVTDKRTDGTCVTSIRGKEFREKAAEDSTKTDGSQEVFSHLPAMPEETGGSRRGKR